MKRAGRFTLVLLLIAIGVAIDPPGEAVGQAVLHVDASCVDSDDDGRCDDGVTYRTIQAAVDDADPGATIEVAAGLYVEQVQIDKDLTLVGTGPCTVVQPPETMSECPPSSGYTPVICVRNATDVQLIDLTVDGDGRGNGLVFHGVGFYEAGGRVSGVEIRGVHDTPFGNTIVRGVGLYAHSDSPRQLLISRSAVHDFHKNGMELGGSGLTVQVDHSTIVGRGPTSLVVQNGIVVRDGAVGTIGPGNRVEGLAFAPQGSASGVLVWFASADVVTSTIADAQVGIYYWAAEGRASGNTVVATRDGVGGEGYWGIIASSADQAGSYASPGAALIPLLPAIDAAVAPAARGQIGLEIDENTLLGGSDVADSAGIWLAPGAGTGETQMSATGNRISGWADGVRIVQKAGVNLDVGVHWSSIAGNTAYGLHVSGSVAGVRAERNWWGEESGPAPYGGGNAVTAGVPVAPWLVRTALPLVSKDFTPPPPYPDLRVSSVTVEPTSPRAGELVTVTVEVENVGPTKAGPFWVDLYDNPTSPPEEANQIWNWLCPGPVEECYGIAWYVEEGLEPGESIQLSSLTGWEEPQTHWTGGFVTPGRHDIYAFVDSWNRTVWYGAVLEQNEGVDNQYGPVVVCVQPGVGGEVAPAGREPLRIPPRPNRP